MQSPVKERLRIKKFQNVFFDLDGTVTNPLKGIANSYLYAIEKLGLAEAEPGIITTFIGSDLQTYFTERHNLTGEHVISGVIFYREYFSVKGLYENELYEGMEELLRKLYENKHNLFLVTSKPTIYAAEILKHFKLSNYFKNIYGSELSQHNTAKEILIADTLKHEKLDPADCLMIGDRKFDVIGAKVNGVSSAAVTYGYGTNEELKECKPDYIIDSVEGLYKLFK